MYKPGAGLKVREGLGGLSPSALKGSAPQLRGSWVVD